MHYFDQIPTRFHFKSSALHREEGVICDYHHQPKSHWNNSSLSTSWLCYIALIQIVFCAVLTHWLLQQQPISDVKELQLPPKKKRHLMDHFWNMSVWRLSHVKRTTTCIVDCNWLQLLINATVLFLQLFWCWEFHESPFIPVKRFWYALPVQNGQELVTLY